MARYSPLWIQEASYAASLDRQVLLHLAPLGEAVGAVPAAVSNTMNVSIPAGRAIVPLQAGQGAALCVWDAAEVVTLGAAPGSGTSRIDRIVCQVRDTAIDSGANTDFIFNVVAGTAAASPTAPAMPANSFVMCDVLVPGTVANLNTATVTDRRLGAWWPFNQGAWTSLGAQWTLPELRVDGRGRASLRGAGTWIGTVASGSVSIGTLPAPCAPLTAHGARFVIPFNVPNTQAVYGVPAVDISQTSGVVNMSNPGGSVTNPWAIFSGVGPWDCIGPFW